MSRLKTISDKLDYIAMGKLNAEQMEYICEINQEVNLKDIEIERLNNIIKETSEDLHQVVKWCTENKHNEDTIERYLVVDYGTIVGKINEIRTKLDKGSDKE